MKQLNILKALLPLAFLAALPAQAQTLGGTFSNAVLAGYGQVGWRGTTNSDGTNDFTVGFSPVLLYSLGQDFLFESELEFEAEGDETSTSLEYAQVDYLGLDNLVITAGKFLVPFGLFSERYHPTWINKLPSKPALYGDSHGGVSEGGVVPVMADVGLMARYRKPLSDEWGLNVSAWVTQGPKQIVAADEDEEGGDHSAASKAGGVSDEGLGGDIPALGFGISSPDNNSNKMVGARVGLVKGPNFEIYAGGFHARTDDESKLDVVASHLSMDYRKNNFDFKAEGVASWQDVEHEGGIEVLKRAGYYLQLARRVGSWEPVVRWSHVLEADLAGTAAAPEVRDVSFGVNYWFQPSIPLKLAYHADLDGDDHILIQWAYGF
jgi:hypothetical protein